MAACWVFDILRGFALLIGLAAGTKERLSDLIFTTWFGLGMFLFPEKVLDYQVSDKTKTDGIMILWMRCIGVSQLMTALFMWMTRDSRDDTVKGSILLSRILGTAVMLLIMVYGQIYKASKFGHGHLWFVIPFFVGILLHNICQLYRLSPNIGRKDQKGIVSVICRLYFLVVFLMELHALAFPAQAMFFMNTQTQFLHQHLIRVGAASDFGMIFMIWYAPSFLRDEDRKSLFISNLVAGGVGTLVLVMSCLVDKVLEVSQLYWILLFMLPLILPAIGLGLIIRKEQSKSAIFTTHYNTRSKSD